MTLPSRKTPDREVVAAHTVIAPVSTLLRDRRALYRLAVELVDADAAAALSAERLDSPLVRHTIGQLLAGQGPSTARRPAPPAFPAEPPVVSVAGVRLATGPGAFEVLAGALEDIRLRRDLGRADGEPLELLTEAAGPRFAAARSALEAGAELARRSHPRLFGDLLPHISLIALARRESSGGLLSASSREFPGLVLLAEPTSALEAAEGLIHEGAHQKLFDFEITREFFGPASDRCAPFQPPWHPDGRNWYVDQTLAAAHAYACLAQFAATVPPDVTPAADSLLPSAARRRDLIAAWLVEHAEFLDAGARQLVEVFFGDAEAAEPRAVGPPRLVTPDNAPPVRQVVLGERVLVGLPSCPPSLYWVSQVPAGPS